MTSQNPPITVHWPLRCCPLLATSPESSTNQNRKREKIIGIILLLSFIRQSFRSLKIVSLFDHFSVSSIFLLDFLPLYFLFFMELIFIVHSQFFNFSIIYSSLIGITVSFTIYFVTFLYGNLSLTSKIYFFSLFLYSLMFSVLFVLPRVVGWG